MMEEEPPIYQPSPVPLTAAIPLDEEAAAAELSEQLKQHTLPPAMAITSRQAIAVPMGGETPTPQEPQPLVLPTPPPLQAAVYGVQPQPSSAVHVHVGRREEPCEACASLVLAIIGCFCFAIPCLGPIAACVGCSALCKINGNENMTGRGKAIWGIILGLAGVIITVVLFLVFGGIAGIAAAFSSDGSDDTDDFWN